MFYKQFLELCNRNGTKPTPLIKSLGLSPGNLKRWENGSTVNSDILLKLSEHFGVSVDYLLTGKEKKSLTDNLSENEQEMLDVFSKFNDREQIKLIGRLEELYRQKQIKELQKITATQIQNNQIESAENPKNIKMNNNTETVLEASRSFDNQPPKLVTGDFSEIVNAPDATDEY